jgi:hypothetical protein
LLFSFELIVVCFVIYKLNSRTIVIETCINAIKKLEEVLKGELFYSMLNQIKIQAI